MQRVTGDTNSRASDPEAPVRLALPLRVGSDVELAARMVRRVALNAGIGNAASSDIAEAALAVMTAMLGLGQDTTLQVTVEGRGAIARLRAVTREPIPDTLKDPGHRNAWVRGLCDLDGPVAEVLGPGVQTALRLMDSVRVQRTESGELELVAVRLQKPTQTSRDVPRIVGYRVVGSRASAATV